MVHSHDGVHPPSDTSSLAHYHDEKSSGQHEHENHDGSNESVPENETSPDGEEKNSHQHSHVIVFDTHPSPHTAIASPFLVSACLAEKIVLKDEQRPEEPSYEFLMPPQLA